MSIQVLNITSLQPRLAQRGAHRPCGAGPILGPGSDMIGIGRGAVAHDFGQRLGATRQCMIQCLQHQQARTFGHDKAVPSQVRGGKPSRDRRRSRS